MRGRNAYPKPLDRYIFFAGRGVEFLRGSLMGCHPFNHALASVFSIHQPRNLIPSRFQTTHESAKSTHTLQSNHHVKDQTALAVVSVTNLKQLFLYSKLFFTFLNLFFRPYFQKLLKHKK